MENTFSGLIATSFLLQVAQSYLELCLPYSPILQDTTLLDGSPCSSRCNRFSVPPFQHTGGGGYVETSFSLPGCALKLVSAYVENSFNVPPGTLKLEKAQFQAIYPSFRLPTGTLKLVSAYRMLTKNNIRCYLEGNLIFT